MTSEEVTEYQKSYPVQLELFQLTNGNEKYYSNTIEFWDMIPKFFYGKMSKERKDVIDKKTGKVVMKALLPLEREVKYNKSKFYITVTPAVISEGYDVPTAFYASTREELIEEVLRKLLAEGRGGFFDDEAGVFFSLSEIQTELKNNEHTYSINEIKEGLNIMEGSLTKIRSEKGVVEYSANILTHLVLASKSGRATRSTKGFCTMHPLVTKSIKELSFRKFDYSKCIKYRSPLARYIRKRLTHNYKQADRSKPYIIKMSTLINDSGHNQNKSVRKKYEQLNFALNELKEDDTVVNYHFEPLKEKHVRMKIVDYMITMIPSDSFVDEVIGINTKAKTNDMVYKVRTNQKLDPFETIPHKSITNS